MAFSVVASSSLLSSRVSTPLKKQNKRNSRNSHAFSCKAMSDAEIDAKYPVGGSVYKVKSFWTFPSVFPLSCSVVTIHHRQNQCLLLILAMKEKKKKLFAFSNWSFFLPYADDEAEIRENLCSPLCFLFIQKIKLKTLKWNIFFPSYSSIKLLQVVLDCSQSNIALGLLLKPGEDGRPVVKTVRPGGKALGKVSVGDTILATTYVGLTNISENSWGKADRGWVDTAAVSYDDANAAMTTNANTIGLILDHEYKPSGGGARAVTSSNGEDAKAWAKAKAAELKAKRSR